MKKLRWLLSTRMPGSVMYPRLFLALLVWVAGMRAFGGVEFLGRSRLARSPFEFGETTLMLAGMVLCVSAVLLAVGFFTRLVALIPLVVSGIIMVDQFSHLGSLYTSSAVDAMIMATGACGVSLLLFFRGGGVWSVDASLTRKQ